jgi:GST-like protein
MIDVLTWSTPNGHKVHILLEELGLPYRVVPIDITKGDQFKPEFLKISPQNKIPAIVDPDGPAGKPMALFESGAILIYLAEKTGSPLLPASGAKRYETLAWLMFQMGHVGPMLGQVHHFLHYAPAPVPYAIDRYTNEAKRLYGVLDRVLSGRDYLTGDYSIADIAIYPWTRVWKRQKIEIDTFPNVKRWIERLGARPAVERGMAVLSDTRRRGPIDEKTREMFFGKSQYEKR